MIRKVQTNTDYKNLPIFAQYFIKTIPHQSILKVDILSGLISKLNTYSFDYLAIDICDILISNATKLSLYDLGYVHYLKSHVLTQNEQYILAISHLEICANKAIKIKDDTLLAISYTEKSRILEILECYQEALNFINSSIEIQEKNNLQTDTDATAISYNQKSRILQSLEQYPKALEFIELSIKIQEKNNPEKNTYSLASSYDQKSRLLLILNQHQSALDLINLSIEIEEKIYLEKNTIFLARAYEQKSSIFFDLNQFHLALNFTECSVDIIEKNYPENHNLLAERYAQKSSILFNLGQLQLALEYVNLSIDILLHKDNSGLDSIDIANKFWLKSQFLMHLNFFKESLEDINVAISMIQVEFPNSVYLQNYEATKKLILEKLK